MNNHRNFVYVALHVDSYEAIGYFLVSFQERLFLKLSHYAIKGKRHKLG